MVETTEKTGQKCEPGKPFDVGEHFRKKVCQSPKPAGELVVKRCVQGFWEKDTYSRYECADGTIVIIGGPIRSERTTEPCEDKVPTETNSAGKEQTAPKEHPKEHSTDHSTTTPQPTPEKLPKVSPPPPPPAPKETVPPPPPPTTSAPTSSASTYVCNKMPCDCAKATPKKVCKTGSGCACTKG